MQSSVPIKIVVMDYYMSAPIPGLDVTYSDFRATAVSQVPILRCFGSAENGKKICVHIHGVFPYLYIPYSGKDKPEQLMYQIASALDKAINVSFNQASSNNQHVYKISLVSGIPMYGYHSKKHQFFKIYLYNPQLISKVGSILLNKNILEQMFQPHEIHLNFTLQFMIDYNLHGMSNMLISEMKYRVNPDNRTPDVERDLFLPANIEKTSVCELEADINAESILNRQEILSGNLAVNPGIAALWEDEKQRRRNKNEDSQLGNFLELKNMFSAPTKTHLIFQQALKERLAVLSTDKDVPRQNPDNSIYPAETPSDSRLQNASIIDIHSVSSLELSLDDTLNLSYSQAHNETITPSGDNLNITMDEDAQDFLHLLEELAGEKVAENEDMSILSQVMPHDEDDVLADDYLDLSMPLASLTTPTKINNKPVNDRSDDEDIDYLNTTLVPQIDGQIDFMDSDNEHVKLICSQKNKEFTEKCLLRKKPGKKKCGRSMPLLDFATTLTSPLNKSSLGSSNKLNRIPFVNIEPLDQKTLLDHLKGLNRKVRFRRTPEEILEEKLRLICYRIRRIDAKSRIRKIGKIVHMKENFTVNLLKKIPRPKFNVLPGRKWFLETSTRDGTNSTIITRLLELTHNYTDPDLRYFIKSPSVEYFFNYKEFPLPDPSHSDSHYQLEHRKTENKDVIRRRMLLVCLQKQILNLKPKAKRNQASGKSVNGALNNTNKKLKLRMEKYPEITAKECLENVELPTGPEQLVPKHETDLQKEVQEANLILQSHLRYLKDFNLGSCVRNGPSPLRNTKNLSSIQCLNTNADQARKNKFCNVEQELESSNNNILHYDCHQSSINGDKSNYHTSKEHVFSDSDLEIASILGKKLKYESKINQFPSSVGSDSLKSSSCDAESDPLSNLVTLRQKITFKRSNSVSVDSDYASISGNASTRNSSDDSDNGCGSLFENNLGDSVLRDSVSRLSVNSPISSQKQPYDSKNELNLENRTLSHSQEKQKVKPRIRVLSDVQILTPFKAKSVPHSSSSIPLGCGLDAVAKHCNITRVKSKPNLKSLLKRHPIPNMYINCDGAADSSSEGEQERQSNKRTVRKKLRSYAPLGITVTKSPKVPGNYPARLADSTRQIYGGQEVSQKDTSQVNQTSLIASDIPYKRKLVFEHETTLNQTTSKEFLSCAYSPTVLKTISSRVTQSHTATANPIKSTGSSDVVEPNNSQNYDMSSSSDSDLFSEEDNLNRSFFKSYNLTVSEKYDHKNMFKAKEGCSTIFSPSSMPLSSSSGLETKVLSDNTSSDIPPYQEVISSNKSTSSLPTDQETKVSSYNTGSDIPPYQEVILTNTDIEKCLKEQSKIIRPQFKAPNRSRIEESLAEYNIPRVQQQEPFYGNVDDYTGTIELGLRTMRVASKTTAHLPEFQSEYNGVNHHRKYFVESVSNLTWNSKNVKTLRMAHCSNKTVVIHPVRKSPSLKQVKEWVKANSNPCQDKVDTPKPKTQRNKIYIPNSPGDDSDLDLSLSLTPNTDEFNEASIPQSPISPVLDRKKKYRKKSLINLKPPSLRESVLLSEETNKSCQISGISQQNSFGFNKSVQNLQSVRAFAQPQYLTTMVMELHIRTRGDLKPDPQFDCICALFYSVLNDVPESDKKKSKTLGVIAINSLPVDLGTTRPDFLDGMGINCDITYVETEEALVNSFIALIKYWDPDIFAGYEIEMLSWGYLVDRSSVLSINIIPSLGRSQLHKYGKTKLKSLSPELEANIIGRIVLDAWRIMRHEIALQSYTFESIVYHILHRRVPMYACKDLTFWWDHRSNLHRHRVVMYYLQRVETVLELFDKLDFLNRTSELARLFGILFYEVLSRGSQFRVESMMLRLAKPLNYVPVSPDTKQRAQMKAPEYIALVMEPESKLYTDPVIVLDFQSLYPSIIIAYNYCFTTCIGRVNNLGTNHPFEFGATHLKISKKVVEKLCLRDLLNYSPCGVAFVKQKVREGILPRMLKEVLDTRLMVKNSMKENRGNDNLQKVLHNRQLGLKLIANVTYGYTAANFSGRMCCVEVGDSVVSKGRETLQRAIALVENTPEWAARVVYGDTDSMFVLIPGKTKEEAFEIGKKIADAVTADNPDPIKLKLEKVYQPCILQTKKRYVGYMYESPEQKDPVYEAKGIETVRRDGCPAVSKILQKCLTLLFETKNVSLIKSYVLKQFNKIQTGRASIQDLTFAKEYRGAAGYRPGACVPALELARKWKATDRRREPRSGERVPYIIVNGPPGLPLIRLVKSPRDLLNDSSLRPNALYYITKVIIPPVNRCLNLVGADLHVWFNQMPRKNTQYLPNSSPNVKSTISQYFATKICASCSEPTQEGLCAKCCQRPNVTALTLTEKLKRWEENYNNTLLICQSCTGCLNEVVCVSLDCPVLYRRTQTCNDLQQSTYVRELLTTASIFSEDNFF